MRRLWTCPVRYWAGHPVAPARREEVNEESGMNEREGGKRRTLHGSGCIRDPRKARVHAYIPSGSRSTHACYGISMRKT